MTDPSSPDPRVRYFESQLDALDLEIVRQATLCGMPLDNRDQIRKDLMRVLENDTTVCPKATPKAFQLLRAAATMHMTVRDRAFESMGREETMKIVDDVALRLAKRLGIKPGAHT